MREIRLGRLDAFFVFAIDIVDLCESWESGWQTLLSVRADGGASPESFDNYAKYPRVSGRYRRDIEEWMEEARNRQGKAVWTDGFLLSETPMCLEIEHTIRVGETDVGLRARLADTVDSPLHYVKLGDAAPSLKLYRDGIFTYTLKLTLEHEKSSRFKSPNEPPEPPATVHDTVERLKEVEGVAWSAFHRHLQSWLNDQLTTSKLAELFQLRTPIGFSYGISELMRKAKSHKLLVLEEFLNGDKGTDASDDLANPVATYAPLEPAVALERVAVAGLLNTADWYKHYKPEYIHDVAAKNIGYRDDEIYLTDRKATLVSNVGFWMPKDSLVIYRRDIVLAVEYWVGRLALAVSQLEYYRKHPDVLVFEKVDPTVGLERVIAGKLAYARLQESLEATRLVDHGFTRMFMQRLRVEMSIDQSLGFIRDRIDAAAATVGLRSSVTSAEVTSRETLAATNQSLNLLNSSTQLMNESLKEARDNTVMTKDSLDVTQKSLGVMTNTLRLQWVAVLISLVAMVVSIIAVLR